ncbi:MAG: hypothetical protein ACRDXB_03985 [Actinomycetes bacterium]
MSSAWEGTHRRYALTQDVLAEVARTGSPAALAHEIDAVYGDFDTFLCDLRRRWYLIFDTRLDLLLERPPRNLERAVANLWRDLEREYPAIRVLLDAYPEPTAADAHHRAALLAATGVDQDELRTPCVWTRRVS